MSEQPTQGFPEIDTQSPVLPEELHVYVKALAWENTQPNDFMDRGTRTDQEAALAALSNYFEKRPDFADMSPQDITTLLGYKKGIIGENLSEGGRIRLGGVIDQLTQYAENPEEIRETTGAYKRALARQAEAAVKHPQPDTIFKEPQTKAEPLDPAVEAARRLIAGINVSGTLQNTPDIPSPEKNDIPHMVKKVIAAAKGTAVIHTDLAPG